jgi:hypothetical protein
MNQRANQMSVSKQDLGLLLGALGALQAFGLGGPVALVVIAAFMLGHFGR